MSKWSGVTVGFDPGPLPPHPNHGKVTVQIIKEIAPLPEDKPHTSAHALTNMAAQWLRSKYPDALIIREFSIGSYGSALIDVAAVTPEGIIGVEIKGDKDSPSRLPLQGVIYSRAAKEIYLLCSRAKEAKYQGHRPPRWGQLAVKGDGLVVSTKPRLLHEAPLQMIECLWQGEKAKIAKDHGIVTAKGKPEGRAIHERLSLTDLRSEIYKTLMARKWEKIVGYRAGRFSFPEQ